MTRIENRLDAIAELKDGWLDGGGKEVTTKALEAAELILFQPRIYPTEDGGISIEYEINGSPESITITPEGKLAQ